MYIVTKTDCIDTLAHGFYYREKWRNSKAILHPSDPRNQLAANLCSRFSDEVSKLSEEDWLRLKPHFKYADSAWRESVGEACRAVGFRHQIKSISTFVDFLILVLERQAATATSVAA
jgi:hypothetical protein